MQDRLLYDELLEHEEFRTCVYQVYLTKFVPMIKKLTEEKIPVLAKLIEKAAANNRTRWASVYSYNQSDPAFLSDFLSDRMDFLNSLWIEKTPFCKITFQTRAYSLSGKPEFSSFLPLYVPLNSSNPQIPLPVDFGIKKADTWYRDDNNEPFDKESAITEDLTLYVSTDPPPPERNTILTIISLCTVILLMVVFVLINHHNCH